MGWSRDLPRLSGHAAGVPLAPDFAVRFVDSLKELAEAWRLVDRPDVRQRRSKTVEMRLRKQPDSNDASIRHINSNTYSMLERRGVAAVPSISHLQAFKQRLRHASRVENAPSAATPRSMSRSPRPTRAGAGIALIVALIAVWAAFVASLAPFVGRWPVIVQAAFYLIMGIAWIIPLKPLVRWMLTGRFKPPSREELK